MFKKYKISNFTGRVNAFLVIERLQRMNIMGGQNTESIRLYQIFSQRHKKFYLPDGVCGG